MAAHIIEERVTLEPRERVILYNTVDDLTGFRIYGDDNRLYICEPGSVAYTADMGHIRILNTNGEWIEFAGLGNGVSDESEGIKIPFRFYSTSTNTISPFNYNLVVENPVYRVTSNSDTSQYSDEFVSYIRELTKDPAFLNGVFEYSTIINKLDVKIVMPPNPYIATRGYDDSVYMIYNNNKVKLFGSSNADSVFNGYMIYGNDNSYTFITSSSIEVTDTDTDGLTAAILNHITSYGDNSGTINSGTAKVKFIEDPKAYFNELTYYASLKSN